MNGLQSMINKKMFGKKKMIKKVPKSKPNPEDMADGGADDALENSKGMLKKAAPKGIAVGKPGLIKKY